MTAANQLYWEQADWAKLTDIIANPDSYPNGIEIDHRYLEDIRKRLWLIDHIGGGVYDPADYEWAQPTPPAAPEELLYPAQVIVTTNDVKFGWLWWTLGASITKWQHYTSPGPTTDIHPDDNVWIVNSSIYTLMPSPNKYYDWDTNHAPLFFAAEASYGSQFLGTHVVCNPHQPGYRFYPKQVDPKAQHQTLYFKDTEETGYQYKEKVEIDRKIITQPDTLGAIFTSFRYGTDNLPVPDTTVKDPYFWKFLGTFEGNQYANTGGAPRTFGVGNNSPGQGNTFRDHISSSGKYFPGKEPSRGGQYLDTKREWSYNPKVNNAYQNHIEVSLSGDLFLPADSTYNSNFADKYNVSDASTEATYRDHPSVNDELWGENASGFELFMSKMSGGNDWHFDPMSPSQDRWGHSVYYPPIIVEYITEKVRTGVETWPTAWAEDAYNLALAGTWRRTWKYSMGRVSSFMRSHEMGAPSRNDTWSPDAGHWPIAAAGFGDWYGARSKNWPKITEFDDKGSIITAHQDDYTFKLTLLRATEDAIRDLKIGYFIHFLDSPDQPIYNGTSAVQGGYITGIKIVMGENRRREAIIKTTHNSKDAKYVSWNQQISERHDPVSIEFTSDSEFIPGFELQPELLKEMHDILQIKMYQTINVTLNGWAAFRGGGGAYPGGIADTLAEARSTARAAADVGSGVMQDEIDWDDVDTWTTTPAPGGTGVGRIHIATGVLAGAPPVWTWLCSVTREQLAIKLSAGEEAIALLHGEIITIANCIQQNGATAIPVTFGVAGNIITVPADNVVHYYEVPLAVNDNSADVWSIIDVLGGWSDDGEYKTTDATHKSFDQDHFATVGFSMGDIKVGLNWETPPASVFERSRLLHVDVANAPKVDDKPPTPNPPIFHSDPQAYFIYIAESGVTGEPDYIPEHVELWVKADSCLCEDLAGNEPVAYHMVERTVGLDSLYDTNRWNYIKIRDLTMLEAQGSTFNLDAGATQNPSGSITRILYSMSFTLSIGDAIELDGTVYNDGEKVLTGVSDTWFEFDEQQYIAETIPAGATIKLLSGYGELDWEHEVAKDYEFALQAKDTKVPVANVGDFSKYLKPAMPEEWPVEVIT